MIVILGEMEVMEEIEVDTVATVGGDTTDVEVVEDTEMIAVEVAGTEMIVAVTTATAMEAGGTVEREGTMTDAEVVATVIEGETVMEEIAMEGIAMEEIAAGAMVIVVVVIAMVVAKKADMMVVGTATMIASQLSTRES
mmetsp:Transcript_28908/g.74187  ORF Transcript_28908/g.74187 Transcript_28908/m.74187 type:complete len:139 (-) Transcript_28908:1086-1502(-)